MLLGKFGYNRLKIMILTGLYARTIFTIRVKNTGIYALFCSYDKTTPMPIHLLQVGQIEVAAVGEEQIVFERPGASRYRASSPRPGPRRLMTTLTAASRCAAAAA